MIRRILPQILCEITGHSRYLPDVQWSSRSWTHNLFRLYELIFWRRLGIRREAYAYAYKVEGKTIVFRQFFTWEARIAYTESCIRELFTIPKLKFRITIPMLSLPGGFRIPASPYLFAIAVDATGSQRNSGGATPISFSFTCTGSNLVLMVDSISFLQNTSTLSYNSVACTKWDGLDGLANTLNSPEGFYLNAPSTGANTLAGTYSDDDNCALGAVSYTGCSQTSAVIDSHATASSDATTSLALTTTVVSSNCWLVGFANTNQGISAGANTTERVNNAAFGGIIFDSNGTVATGSQSLNVTISPSGKARAVIASIAPAGAAAPTAKVKPTLLLMATG